MEPTRIGGMDGSKLVQSILDAYPGCAELQAFVRSSAEEIAPPEFWEGIMKNIEASTSKGHAQNPLVEYESSPEPEVPPNCSASSTSRETASPFLEPVGRTFLAAVLK